MKLCLLLSLGVTLVSGQSLVSPRPRDCREQGFKGGLPSDGVPLPQYYEGQVMLVKANLVAANGNFEFYLCPKPDPDDEECLVRLITLKTEVNRLELKSELNLHIVRVSGPTSLDIWNHNIQGSVQSSHL